MPTTKLTARTVRKIAEKTKEVLVGRADLLGRFVAVDLVNEETGEIYAEAGEELAEARLAALEDAGIDRAADARGRPVERPVDPQHARRRQEHQPRRRADRHLPRHAPGRAADRRRPPKPCSAACSSIRDRYDLSAVGRVKMNMRLGLDAEDTVRVLRKEDILRTVKILCELKDGRGTIDDIDNLGNRRVRSVGELMENQYRVGLLRMERAIRERMGSVDIDTVMPHDLINAKPAAAAVREFFGSVAASASSWTRPTRCRK